MFTVPNQMEIGHPQGEPAIWAGRYPCAWLTMIGFRYTSGEHPSDIIADMLVESEGKHNPQLHDRLRDTVRNVLRGDSRWLEHRVQ